MATPLFHTMILRQKLLKTMFSETNGINLGDVAQSMVIHNGEGYVVVNNSGIIFIIDTNTFKVRV